MIANNILYTYTHTGCIRNRSTEKKVIISPVNASRKCRTKFFYFSILFLLPFPIYPVYM